MFKITEEMKKHLEAQQKREEELRKDMELHPEKYWTRVLVRQPNPLLVDDDEF